MKGMSRMICKERKGCLTSKIKEHMEYRIVWVVKVGPMGGWMRKRGSKRMKMGVGKVRKCVLHAI